MYPEKLLNAVLREDFGSFLNKVFGITNPGTPYLRNWHIDLMGEYLEAVRLGHIKRLVINLPPRSLKSVCVNVAWPAWILGKTPYARVISASYSQILSVKHSLDCRSVVSSEFYKNLFPGTVVSPGRNQKSKFSTTENGFRFATSVGGSVTGEGGDFLIIDDPHNPAHIKSKILRDKVIEWFEQTFVTRLNDKGKGCVVLVMQRLHKEDLSGFLLSGDKNWERLKIPVRAGEDIIYSIGKKEFLFKKGGNLHSERDSEEILTRLEKEVGLENFAAQYMQDPLEEGSSFLMSEEINFYETPPEKFDYYALSLDSAIKVSDKSDYSVLLCFGISGKNYYLVSALREKLAYPDLKREIKNFSQKYRPRFLIIEDKASGQQLLQDLKYENFRNLVPVKPKMDKISRFASVVDFFREGRVLVPRKSSFTQVFLNEILKFPASKNDDIVDALSQFLNFAKEIEAKPSFAIRNI